VQNDRIHEFKVDFEKRSNNLTGAKKKGVLEAIEVIFVLFVQFILANGDH